MKRFSIIICLLIAFTSLGLSQDWTFVEDFVEKGIGGYTHTLGSMPHGVVVTPDQKVWIGFCGTTDTFFVEMDTISYRPLWVYNADGTLDRKIQFLTYDSVTDTIFNTCRGLSLDNNGNVLFSSGDCLWRINYQTYEAMNKVIPAAGVNLTEAACDENGYIYIKHVAADGLPIYIYDHNFNLYGYVDDNSNVISRTIVTTPDGHDIYLGRIYGSHDGGAGNGGIIHYHSDNGPDGTYIQGETYVNNIWAQCLDWDKNGLLWVGSHWDVGEGELNGWYALDPAQDFAVIDSFGQNVGMNPEIGPQPPEGGSFYAPRGVAWSADGETMYSADFDGSVIKKWIYNELGIIFENPEFTASTFYSNIPGPDGIAVLSNDSLLVVNEYGGPLGVFLAVEGDQFGTEDAFSTIGEQFVNPDDILLHMDGTVFVADGQAQIVFKIPSGGGTPESFVNMTTTGSGNFCPFGLAIAPVGFDGPNVDPGDLIVADNNSRAVWAVNLTTGIAKAIAQGNVFADGPLNPAFGLDGTLYIFENNNPGIARIVTLGADGTVTPFLTNIPSRSALAIHPITGDLYFKYNWNEIHKIAMTGGTPQLFASNIGGYQDLAFNAEGTKLFLSSTTHQQIIKITGFQTSTPANITFQADLTDFIANGWFDPSDPADSIVVNGDHNGWNSLKKMVPDETNPNIYVYTANITRNPGEIIQWKFRIFPGTKWLNIGWELDANQQTVFTGADMILDPEVPNCEYAGEPISQDVTVTFSVDMSTYYGEYINVSLQGDSSPLDWNPGSTIMSDPEGDGVYTVDILFTAGTGKNIMYKYTVQTNPWNWEPFQGNRHLEIDDSSPTQVLEVDQWGILPGTGSAYFDGTDDYVKAEGVSFPSGDLTIEAWIHPTALTSIHEIVFFYDDTSTTQFRTGSGGELLYGESNSAGWNYIGSPANRILTNTWTHVAVTKQGDQCTLYINGVHAGYNQINNDIVPNTLSIGARSNYPDRIFEGNIDEVRIWTVARSQSEIQTNMTNYLDGTETGLYVYYRMNEGLGQTVFDLSGNGHDGQFGSTPGTDVNDPAWIVTDWPYEIPTDANFSADITAGNLPLTVQFTDLSTGNLVSWAWDFESDGTIDSYDRNPEWTYTDFGFYTVSLTVNNGTDTDTETKTDYITVYQYIAHDNNNILFTVFNNGVLGIELGGNGEGFQFNGANGLYEGDLLIAQSASQVSGVLYSRRDYRILDTIEPISSSLSGFDRAYETRFDDQRAPNPIGVEITQRSHSKSTSPDNDYVIMDYGISNTSGSDLNGIYIGLAMDWDVGTNDNNLGGYDAQRKSSYIYEVTEGQSNPNYYGMTALSGNVSGHSLWAWDDESIEDEGSNNFLYQSMTSFSEMPIDTSDLRAILATGPYSITAGSSVRAVFAILGGTDLADLQANADAALAIDLEGEIPELSHFSPIYTGNPYLAMNIYVTGATIDGVGLSVGDEIGIFDGEYCVGAGIVIGAIDPYLALVASTDDPGTTDIDGFTPGHEITYRLWDSGEEVEISNVDTTYSLGDGTFSSQGTAMVNLEGLMTVGQDIGLNTGWNIMSFYAEPEDMNLQSIVQSLIDNSSLLKIQDETGAAIEELPVIGWINNIGDMSVSEGYYIKVNSDQVLALEGNPADLPTDITLDAGWNIMGYPVASAQDAMSALQPLIDAGELLKVQDETGAAIEELPVIGWVNNIGNFKPDEGYYVKVSSSTSISLDDPSKLARVAVVSESENIPTHFVTSFEGNPYLAMNIYILKAILDDNSVKQGTEIGVFYRELCVGTAALTRSLEPRDSYLSIIVSTDDPLTEEVDGFIPGSSVSFRLWDGKDEYTMSATPCSDGEDLNVLRFESQGTMVVELAGNTVPKEYRLYSCYPNPFNPTTNIRYDLPNEGHVKLLVFDLQGRLIRTLVSEQREAGYQSVIWDGRDDNGSMLPSGMYFYQLSAGSFSQVKKMALVK